MLWRPFFAKVKVNHRILAFLLECVLLPWQQGWLKTRLKNGFCLFKKNLVVRLFSLFAHYELTLHPFCQYCSTGLLIFRAVAEPRISSKSAKSREIHKNTRNTAKFAGNLTKYMSAQHIWKLSWLLGLLTCCKRANLPWNFVVTTASKHPKTTRRSYTDVAKNWEASGKQRC